MTHIVVPEDYDITAPDKLYESFENYEAFVADGLEEAQDYAQVLAERRPCKVFKVVEVGHYNKRSK